MKTEVRLNLKKRKIIKEDGRYLIFFSFEQVDSAAEDGHAPPGGEIESAPTAAPFSAKD